MCRRHRRGRREGGCAFSRALSRALSRTLSRTLGRAVGPSDARLELTRRPVGAVRKGAEDGNDTSDEFLLSISFLGVKSNCQQSSHKMSAVNKIKC